MSRVSIAGVSMLIQESTRPIGGMLALAIFLSLGLLHESCSAQRKYENPNDPRVKAVADKCVEFIEERLSGGNIGGRTVGALSIIEHSKRYTGEVPMDHPGVKGIIDELSSLARSGSDSVIDGKEMYFPCLAMITLAEYDAKKYKKEIEILLDGIIARQLDHGGYSYKGQVEPDTSQSQFAALAFYVAYQHRIPFNPKYPQKLLQFFVDYQANNGSWNYRPRIGEVAATRSNSIHSASLSSVYLLADMLNLSRRVKNFGPSSPGEAGLPKNVSLYIPPIGELGDGKVAKLWARGDEPVVKFDKKSLSASKSQGNSWYESNFTIPGQKWNAYFMYAFERYAFFKEQADGRMGGSTGSWYDRGVDYLAATQAENGSFTAKEPAMFPVAATSLSLLFLVRASEVISLPPAEGELGGGEGFGSGTITQRADGTIVASDAQQSLSSLMGALQDDNLDERQLAQLNDAMKRAIREFKSSGKKSRVEIKAFLQSMISEKNFLRRMIAIKFLASEQDMDNVPALLYALGDPDERVCIEAHNGLRLISRKFDTFKYQPQGNREDNLAQFVRLKQQWTKWFLQIRPDAELLE